MSVTIRTAGRLDAEMIAVFQERMALETEGMKLDPATVRRGVRTILEEPLRGQYLVAEGDGSIVGCMMLLPEWSDWRAGEVLWIHSVFVQPDWRGRGVFKQLFEHVRSRVERDPDLKGLRLFVDRRNTAAQRVYERVGMSSEHYVMYEWLDEKGAS